MLFGKDERVQELFPRSVVTVARHSGENGNVQLVEKLEIKGNLHNQYEAILRFIQRYCDLARRRRVAARQPDRRALRRHSTAERRKLSRPHRLTQTMRHEPGRLDVTAE